MVLVVVGLRWWVCVRLASLKMPALSSIWPVLTSDLCRLLVLSLSVSPSHHTESSLPVPMSLSIKATGYGWYSYVRYWPRLKAKAYSTSYDGGIQEVARVLQQDNCWIASPPSSPDGQGKGGGRTGVPVNSSVSDEVWAHVLTIRCVNSRGTFVVSSRVRDTHGAHSD